MLRYNRLRIVSLILLAAATGCGSKHPRLVPVSGKVTIDGQPLTIGQVKLSPGDHRAAVGRIGEDGSFTMSCFELNDGAPTGTHLVTVTAVEQLTERSNRWHAPMRYANQSQADLWATIDGPTDDLKIELTWKVSKHDGPYVDKF